MSDYYFAYVIGKIYVVDNQTKNSFSCSLEKRENNFVDGIANYECTHSDEERVKKIKDLFSNFLF